MPGFQSVGGVSRYVEVTLSLDTNAYESGDLLADAQEIEHAVRLRGGTALLKDVVVLDQDDQGIEMELYITDDSTSWGTENAEADPSAAVADGIQAVVHIESGDYFDLVSSQLAYKEINAVVKSQTTSLYVAAITRGTPTHTADGVRVKFGFLLD